MRRFRAQGLPGKHLNGGGSVPASDTFFRPRPDSGRVISMTAKPRIGILGTGNVGKALLEGWKRTGHEVRATGKNAAEVQGLARWADVLVLAVPFGERDNALRELGDGVNGKVLVDVTNALTSSHEFAADVSKSGAEGLQEKAHGAKVVKAFNTVFADNMAKGQVKGQPLSLFVAGDHADAKQTVMGLGRELGFDAVDAGPLKNARWLETLGYLAIQLGYSQKMGTQIGFRLVH